MNQYTKIKEYTAECELCGKKITAWSQKQLDWCMKLHVMAKHGEKHE